MFGSTTTTSADALKLDAGERLRLAGQLIDSVEGAADTEWEDAWLREIQARREVGPAIAIPWSEARARVQRRIARS